MQVENKKMPKRTLYLLGVLGLVAAAGVYVVYSSFISHQPPEDLEPVVDVEAELPTPVTFEFQSDILEDTRFDPFTRIPYEGFTEQYRAVLLDPKNPMDPVDVSVEDPEIGGELIIGWNLPSQVNYNMVRIYRARAGNQTGKKIYQKGIEDPFPGKHMTYRDSGLKNGQKYNYVVTLVNHMVLEVEGEEPQDVYYSSKDKTPVAGTPTDSMPPQPPLNVTIEPVEEGIKLSWVNPPEDDFATVIIYRSETKGRLGDRIYPDESKKDDFKLRTTEYVDPVDENKEYFYTLTSLDSSGNESSMDILSAPVRSNPFDALF